MENATKALIMAAEVLVGVMIISVGVYLFRTYGDFSSGTNKEIEDAQIAEFNQQFQKFYGTTTKANGKEEPVECTIHDITSLANLAKKNNSEYELTEQSGYSNSTYYVQIDVDNHKNIEKYTNDQLIELIKTNDLVDGKNTKYYKCTICNISSITKKVNYMKFVEI